LRATDMAPAMALQLDDTKRELLSEFRDRGNLTTGALADYTNRHRTTVSRHLSELQAAGAVEHVHEPTALWRLVNDPESAS
jgi:predicted ArsR family transcriptional regulator